MHIKYPNIWFTYMGIKHMKHKTLPIVLNLSIPHKINFNLTDKKSLNPLRQTTESKLIYIFRSARFEFRFFTKVSRCLWGVYWSTIRHTMNWFSKFNLVLFILYLKFGINKMRVVYYIEFVRFLFKFMWGKLIFLTICFMSIWIICFRINFVMSCMWG